MSHTNGKDAIPTVNQLTVLDENSSHGNDEEPLKVSTSGRKRKVTPAADTHSTSASSKKTKVSSTNVDSDSGATHSTSSSTEPISSNVQTTTSTDKKTPQSIGSDVANVNERKKQQDSNLPHPPPAKNNSNNISVTNNTPHQSAPLKLYWTVNCDSKELLSPAVVTIAKDETSARILTDEELKREGLKPFDQHKYTFASIDFKQPHPVVIDLSADNEKWNEAIPYNTEGKLNNPCVFYCTEIEMPLPATKRTYVPVFVTIADDVKKAREVITDFANKKAKSILEREKKQLEALRNTKPLSISFNPIVLPKTSTTINKINKIVKTPTSYSNVKNILIRGINTSKNSTFSEQGKNTKTFTINPLSTTTPSSLMLYNGQFIRFQHQNI